MINKTLISMMLVIAAGCGGGSDKSEVAQPQPEPQPEPTITPVTPEISKPDHESALNDVSQVITAIDASIESVDVAKRLTGKIVDPSPNYSMDPISHNETVECEQSGTSTVSASFSGYDRYASLMFGKCNIGGTKLDGEFTVNMVKGVTFGSGSASYSANASFISQSSGDQLYVKSRSIKHDVMSVMVNGVTDEVSFDMTVSGVDSTSGKTTDGLVIVKTASALSFQDSLESSPVSGEITITNTSGKVWRAVVVQNGFDIYEGTDTTQPPAEFLSWYSIVQ